MLDLLKVPGVEPMPCWQERSKDVYIFQYRGAALCVPGRLIRVAMSTGSIEEVSKTLEAAKVAWDLYWSGASEENPCA